MERERVVMVEAESYEEALAKLKRGIYTEVEEEEDEEEYSVVIDGNKTIVRTRDGKEGVAKCNPDDEFDVVEGFKVAIERIRTKYHKLTKEERALLTAFKATGATKLAVHKAPEVSGVEFADEKNRVMGGIKTEMLNWLNANVVYEIADLLKNDR